MPTRKSDAVWNGDLKSGNGTVKFGGGAFEGSYTFASRFENGKGTNPEELIGAAHAACYSMALSAALAQSGYSPESVHTRAEVDLEKVDEGFAITTVTLNTEATVPGIDKDTFMEHAEGAKNNCPVSRALGALEIKLNAKLS